MTNKNLSDYLVWFRENEKLYVHNAVILIKDTTLQRILVGWQGIKCETNLDNMTDIESKDRLWDELWSRTTYDEKQLQKKTGIRGSELRRSVDILKGAHMIFPNGTMSNVAKRMLFEMVDKITGFKKSD